MTIPTTPCLPKRSKVTLFVLLVVGILLFPQTVLGVLDYTAGTAYVTGTGDPHPGGWTIDNANDGNTAFTATDGTLYYNAVDGLTFIIPFDDNYTIDQIYVHNIDDGTGGLYDYNFEVYAGTTLVHNGYFNGTGGYDVNATFTAVEVDEISFKIDTFVTGTQGGFGEMIPYEQTSSPPTPNASDHKTETVVKSSQGSDVVLNGFNWQTIMSHTFTPTWNNTNFYQDYFITVESTAGGQPACRINLNGVLASDTVQRGTTANQKGTFFISSNNDTLSNSTSHTVDLECRKAFGSGSITISNGVGTTHELVDKPSGENIPTYFGTFTNTTTIGWGETLTYQNSYTTQTNETVAPTLKTLIFEWNGQASASSEYTLKPFIGDYNCTEVTRGTPSSPGTFGGNCLLENVTNGTAYNYGFYGTGSATYTIDYVIKEVQLEGTDTDNSSYTTADVTTGWTKVTDVDIEQNLGGTASIYATAGISLDGTGDTGSFQLRLSGDSTANGTIIERYAGSSKGVTKTAEVFDSLSEGNYTIELWVDGTNVEWIETELIAFTTGRETPTPNTFTITANNTYTGNLLSTFNITLDSGNTFSTTDGTITLAEDGLQNITFRATDYITKTYQNVNTNTTSMVANLSQSETILWAKEIHTNNLIQTWTLVTEKGNYTTTNYSLNFTPDLGTYSWNWTTPNTYITQTNLAVTIDEQAENLSILNIPARDFTIISSTSLQEINATCTQDGYNDTTNTYSFHNSTGTMSCTLTGYQDKNLTLNTTPDESTYNLTPVYLNLIFTEQTNGYVETIDCDSLPSSCTFFNDTSVFIEQANISTGYVTVKFNPDGTNYQQIFKYYNDVDTHIKTYIQIETPDLVKVIKATSSDGQPLIDTRVCSQTLGTNPETNNTEWLTTYCDYTEIDGQVNILVNDQNTYQFCLQKTGYTATCETHFIPPSDSTITTIQMSDSSSVGDNNYIYSSCGNTIINESTCVLTVIAGSTYNSICIDYVTNTSNGTTCVNDDIGHTFSYTVDATNTDWELDVRLDTNNVRSFNHNRHDGTFAVDVGLNTQFEGKTLIGTIKNNTTYLILAYMIFIIIGVLSGIIIERRFNGYGLYGAGFWFSVVGAMGFGIFWIPAIMIGLFAFVKQIQPMMK